MSTAAVASWANNNLVALKWPRKQFVLNNLVRAPLVMLVAARLLAKRERIHLLVFRGPPPTLCRLYSTKTM